jgi:hypothetical protein
MDVEGTNWFNEKMIDLFIWIEHIYPFNDGFMVQIIAPIPENHTINRVRGVL